MAINESASKSAMKYFPLEEKRIKLRDGSLDDFRPEKISKAILNAGKATGEFGQDVADNLTVRVLSLIQMTQQNMVIEVEKIQDIVEETLLASAFKNTAKAFILYRDQHSRNRELVKKSSLDLINSYLHKLDWQVNENSNMAYSLQGLNNYISSEISKVYWLNEIYTPNIRDAHADGDLHIHDLGLLSVYCVGWDLEDLIRSGFKGVPGKAESKPAKHFRAILGQVVNFFYSLQGEAAGAQAFSNLDTLLAPFIRYDNLSYREVKQAMQEFIFNVNVPTRVGFQTPFTNVTIDLQAPSSLANKAIVIGGEMQKEVYGDFQKEMNMFNKAFFEVLSEGDAKGRVFTFPIPTVNITEDFDWESPEYEPLWTATAKYGIPSFANFVNSDMDPDDARSMCCRLRLDKRELEKRGGGLFGANPMTGSIGVVTINMPRLGKESSTELEFLEKLEHLMEVAKASLETKRKVLEGFTEKNLYPYTKFYLREMKAKNDKYWNNHFSTIGLVGMNEACVNLLGAGIGTEKGKVFAEKVLDFMRDRLITYQEETGNLYNLEATPAEGTSYRLAKIDFETGRGQHYSNNEDVVNQGAKPFYTNSSQLPVNFTDDVIEALDLQDSLQTKYTGGTTQHIFLGESVADNNAVKAFLKMVCNNYELPYFTLSPTFSICGEHGYIRGEEYKCPTCGGKTEVYSRVVGYLRPIDQWNEGKRAEFGLRSTFKIEDSINNPLVKPEKVNS